MVQVASVRASIFFVFVTFSPRENIKSNQYLLDTRVGVSIVRKLSFYLHAALT